VEGLFDLERDTEQTTALLTQQTGALAQVVAERYLPSLVLVGGADADGIALLEHRDGAEPTAYVCRAYACDAPTRDVATLAAQLEAIVVAATAG